ncbi:3-oxoadipate enol-lactonase 2 [Variovorax sp. SRS16]|uniref:alpha/beta fold hydrolase n=1 Tax=Variovorax sp. SRS16 TaxID=282217 RepID=UPI001317D11B|nr:alpha/beta fold hydrolase [Variovorax sp. SRS16]VTU14015.1 3-oxoadipate enol-lactonase 2 [Variovorax sp. SRS16]
MKTERIGSHPAIAVRWRGSGELLVFLHGIGGNKSNWDRQLARFGAHAQAVAVDFRGYGESDDYEGAAGISQFADDVARVIRHFGAARAHVVGLSLGGRVAQRLALLHPDLIASLALVDARSDARDTRTPAEREAFLGARSKPLQSGKTPSDIAPAVVKSLVGPNASPAVVAELTQSIASLRTDSYLKTIEANVCDDFAGDLGKIRAPTLVLVGEHDTTTPLRHSQELVGLIPGARLQVIADAGHLTNIEQPEAFNACLAEFLLPQLHRRTE